MEGVMDPIVRDLLTALGGYDLCVSEFLRVTTHLLPDHIFYRLCPELAQGGCTPSGVPVHLQLLGGDPICLAENAAKARWLGAPGIDLNFGCPAKTVNRHDGGASLLKYPERIYQITSCVREALPADCPLSAKIRLGYSDTLLLKEVTQALESAGTQWITLHARTKEQGYRPPAHWDWLAKVREWISIPLVANGDIWSREDFERCRSLSGCTDFMLGRGAFARPDLALQLRAAHDGVKSPNLDWTQICILLLKHGEKAAGQVNEVFALQRSKQWIKHLQRNYASAVGLFNQIKAYQKLDPILRAIRAELV